MRKLATVAAATAFLTVHAAAQDASCNPAAQDLPAQGAGFQAPAGATAITGFVVKDPGTGAWRPTADLPVPPPAHLDAEAWRRFATGVSSADGLAAIWAVRGGTCLQLVHTPASPPGRRGFAGLGGASGAAPGTTASGLSEEECPSTGDALASCQQCAAAWRARLDRELRGHRYSLAVYTEGGEAFLIQNGTAGEPILFGIYSEESTQWEPLRMDPCAIEPDAPAVFVSTPGLTLGPARQGERFYLRRYPSRRCFNPSVDIRVTGKKGSDALLVDHPLQQSQRYRGTVQLGAVFTPQHLHGFAVRPSGTSTVIYDQGPTGTGTEYQVALVLYALPRSLLSIFGAPYPGRDLVHDQGFLDRLGGLVGVSLSDPSRRFYAGLSFEVLYGVNATWGVELFRGRELAGVAVGDAFSATDAIPTRERWGWDKVWGVSIDLLYVKNLYGGNAPR